MRRLTITLQDDERDALYTLSQNELRNIQEQAVILVRRELERRGLLPASEPVEGAIDWELELVELKLEVERLRQRLDKLEKE